jgi:hypothetical protein
MKDITNKKFYDEEIAGLRRGDLARWQATLIGVYQALASAPDCLIEISGEIDVLLGQCEED